VGLLSLSGGKHDCRRGLNSGSSAGRRCRGERGDSSVVTVGHGPVQPDNARKGPHGMASPSTGVVVIKMFLP